MKKILLLAAAFLLATTSCSKDDPGIPDGTYNPARKISKIYKETFWNGESQGKELAQTWTWNGDRLIHIQYAYASEPILFSYDGDRVVSITTEDVQFLFIYQGKLLQRVDLTSGGQSETIMEVLEHQDGYITWVRFLQTAARTSSMPEGAVDRLGDVLTKLFFPSLSLFPFEGLQTRASGGTLEDVRFVYQDGNIVRQIRSGQEDGEVITITSTYDNQNNPFCSGLPFATLELFSPSGNNPLMEEVFSEGNGQVRFSAVAYTYLYEKGFPVQANRYFAGGSDFLGITYYEYL